MVSHSCAIFFDFRSIDFISFPDFHDSVQKAACTLENEVQAAFSAEFTLSLHRKEIMPTGLIRRPHRHYMHPFSPSRQSAAHL